MNYEDFLDFAYPAMILLGVLLSLIPAYIASQKDKSFWLWWISTAFVFVIPLLVLIKTQAVSLLIYLLPILPIASILALLPSPSRKKTLPPISTVWAVIKSDRFYGVYGCLFVLIFAGILYYYLLPHKWDYQRWGDQFYPAILAFVFLIACLGYALFIFMLSEKRKGDVFNGFLLTVLLSIPILLSPSRAFSVLEIRNLIAPQVDLGSVIAALIAKPVGGIFILFGLCSVPAAALILFNNKYGVVNIVASILRSADYSPPYIQFSKTRFRSVSILVFSLLFLTYLRVFFHPTEGWMFSVPLGFLLLLFPPLTWLCLILPVFLFSFAGIVLSTLAIGMSVSQKKPLYALCILSCGILAGWKGISAAWYPNFFGLPGTLLVFYGAISGLIALILWVISDYRGQNKTDGAKP